MKTLIVEYLRLRAAEIGGVDEHLGLTEKREGGDVSVPYIYVGGGDVRPVNIDSGSLGWFSTYQKDEFVTVDGMKAAKDIQGTFYIRYAAILHRDTRDHNEYAEDIANAFTGVSSDLKNILKARTVNISRSSIETDITRAWREEFTTPVTDLNYRLGMVLVDVTVNVIGSRDCWQGCSELADILQGFDWCNPATFARLTPAQQQCVADQIPCEDANYQLRNTDGDLLSTGSIPSGDTDTIIAPDVTVLRDGLAYDTAPSGTTIDVPSNCPAPPYPPEWTRNPDWDAMPTPSANDYIALFLVFETKPNTAAIQVNVGGGTIDWGDGSTVAASGATQFHTYDYAALAGAVNVDPYGYGNYKQVFITVSGGTITSLSLSGATLIQGWADIAANMPSCTTYFVSSVATGFGRKFLHIERIVVTALASGCSCGNILFNVPNIAVLDLPWASVGSANNILFSAGRNLRLGNVIVDSAGNNSFASSGILTMTSLTITSSSGVRQLDSSRIKSLQTITFPASTTSLLETLEATESLTSPVTINAAGVTNIQSICQDSSLPKLTITNAAGITVTTNAFNRANLCDGVILNGITVGFSLNGTNCTSQGGLNTMTAIGTAAGAQTIDCRNTPFATDYANAVPLAITAYNLGVSKGFSITMS